MRYIEWVQTVLLAALEERPAYQPLMIHELAERFALPTDADGKPQLRGLDYALRDLAPHGFVIYSTGSAITYPPEARRYRNEPITSLSVSIG